jgi:hypothetical protein
VRDIAASFEKGEGPSETCPIGTVRDIEAFFEQEETNKAHSKSIRAGPSRILKDNDGFFEKFECDSGFRRHG